MSSKFFNNTTERIVDDLKITLKKGSRVNIAAASFSIYAYQLLKKELQQIESLNFIFTNEVFTEEEAPHEAREFYIPRLNAERNLYGTEFEIKLRNELNQKAIAKECADWIREKVRFRANIARKNMPPFMTVENNDDEIAYNPFHNFTTADLGADKGNIAYSITTKFSAPQSKELIKTFNSVWENPQELEPVTEKVLEKITAAYKENSPEFVYFLSLFNIFREFLETLDTDTLPKEAVGFKETEVWKKLYSFQKDAVKGCITKLEKHNGCILADSVGLGKTFSALGVIKYYEMRNDRVLVLCPKRLSENWNTYKGNYKNNPLANDRFNYDVLYHTDLSRDGGYSNGINLQTLNWENYDLVVIDESHNFRNGNRTTTRHEDDDYENRYEKLISRILASGVETKVLMLSATPVNTNFSDLRNQLSLAEKGKHAFSLDKTLGSDSNISKIFSDASSAFKKWSDLEPEERTSSELLSSLSFDFFKLLDSVTIARSRKHIEQYYQDENLGSFPTRLSPISHRPDLTDISNINYNIIFKAISELNLEIYTPLKYVHTSLLGKYLDLDTNQGRSWKNREQGRNVLMTTNLLKRLESSVHAFRLTLSSLFDTIDHTTDTINHFLQGRDSKVEVDDFDTSLLEEDEGDFSVGKKFKIDLADMDYISWQTKLEEDKEVLNDLLRLIEPITKEHDLKLKALADLIAEKVTHPTNDGNKKLLIFTAFADTANYLYDEIAIIVKENFGLNTALITGSSGTKTTLENIEANFNTILTCFSPLSKNRDALFDKNPGEIDIVIATDCISEGQNLQDCDQVVNYDIHWNPVRIIQRFGRVDRIGSPNKTIQLVNFWPNMSLDEYINLKARVENRMAIVNIAATGSDNPINLEDSPELEYRKRQLEKIQSEAVDLEDMNTGISITDLGLNEFHLDLQELHQKYGDGSNFPHGIHAIAKSTQNLPKGVIFVLKNINSTVNINTENRLHPFYLVYIKDDGEVFINHLQPKNLLDKFRLLSKHKTEIYPDLVSKFNEKTNDGKDMSTYTRLLTATIQALISQKDTSDLDSLFSPHGTTALVEDIKGLDDFELISFLVVK